MYQPHPSAELNRQFALRPYQGVEPSAATFLFIGLDANYAEDVEHTAAFQNVLEYHQDGVAFWRRHGVHHPFLLSAYRGSGRRFHKGFARIGFNANHAALVSFSELLHVPTVGRNKLAAGDLEPTHLRMLNAAIVDGTARHIFVCAGVASLMRETAAFPWLAKTPKATHPFPVLYQDSMRTVHLHLHFSNYGKFQRQLETEAAAIAGMLPKDPS